MTPYMADTCQPGRGSHVWPHRDPFWLGNRQAMWRNAAGQANCIATWHCATRWLGITLSLKWPNDKNTPSALNLNLVVQGCHNCRKLVCLFFFFSFSPFSYFLSTFGKLFLQYHCQWTHIICKKETFSSKSEKGNLLQSFQVNFFLLFCEVVSNYGASVKFTFFSW